MLNVYEQVDYNKFKSTLIIGFFIAFIVGAAYLISYAFNLGSGFVISALGFSVISSFASYFYGDKIILSMSGAKRASRKEFFNLYTVTENLSLAADIPMPQIYLIDSPALNAFATGRDPKHSVLAITRGLLDKLNRTQLEAVIAHEISHIKNYDIRLMMIVSILLGTLSLLINMSTQGWMFGGRDRDRDRGSSGLFAIIGIILIIFAPLLAQLIQFALSRRREYLADASGVKLTRQPEGLIQALEIISQNQNIPLATANTATAPLYISNPFKGQKIASLFSTHPPIEDRIATLKQML